MHRLGLVVDRIEFVTMGKISRFPYRFHLLSIVKRKSFSFHPRNTYLHTRQSFEYVRATILGKENPPRSLNLPKGMYILWIKRYSFTQKPTLPLFPIVQREKTPHNGAILPNCKKKKEKRKDSERRREKIREIIGRAHG